MCTHQFTGSACSGDQPRGVKPDRQCLSLPREPHPGNGERKIAELPGFLEASDQTRMANTCEPSSEPSSVSSGQRQLGPGQNGNVVGQRSRTMRCGTTALPGERRSLNGELMRSGERGNPDHPPNQQ